MLTYHSNPLSNPVNPGLISAWKSSCIMVYQDAKVDNFSGMRKFWATYFNHAAIYMVKRAVLL